MSERRKNPLELLGLCLIVGGICLLALSQMMPDTIPAAATHIGSMAEYSAQLEIAQSGIRQALRYSFIGGWAVNIGCFVWIGGLLLSIAEILLPPSDPE